MFSYRPVHFFSFMALFWGTSISAQMMQPSQMQSQPATQPRIQQAPVQQGQMQQQPVQLQPMQMPPFGTQGGTSIYKNPLQPTAQPTVSQPPVGMNTGQQPVRVATNPPATGGQSLYDPGVNRTPQIVQPPTAGQGVPPGMVHMGRAEPPKIVPFVLNPAEQQMLEEFLVRWEKYSAGINRYDVSFNLFQYDAAIPDADPNKPYRITYGYFQYLANPRRFVYAIEGEWHGDKQIKREGDKNPHIFAEKIIIDDKAVYQYDYSAKTLRQNNIPPELIGKGIADSPLPLIFGAKADELKRRFSMKVVNDASRDDQVRLFAKPLQIEDQQEFKLLEIILDKKTLTATALRQWDIDKTHKTYQLSPPDINPRFNPLDFLEKIKPTVPLGWKKEIIPWVPPQQPPPVMVVPKPQVANPPQRSNEVQLYQR